MIAIANVSEETLRHVPERLRRMIDMWDKVV